MALKTDIRGMVWRYPDTFVVGREQIRQYANSVKATDPASVDEDAADAEPPDAEVPDGEMPDENAPAAEVSPVLPARP